MERNKDNLLSSLFYVLPFQGKSQLQPRFLFLSLGEEMVLQGKLGRCLLSKGERYLLLSSKVVISLWKCRGLVDKRKKKNSCDKGFVKYE